MRRMLVPLAVLGLALTAGCAGRGDDPQAAAVNGNAAVPAGAAAKAVDPKLQEAENLVVDCMKKQGFRYEPQFAPDFETGSESFVGREAILAPTDQLRKFREKYGFGVMSRAVYPKDPMVTTPTHDPATNPNNAIRDGLDPAQRKAYDLALDGIVDQREDGKHKGDVIKPGCHYNAYTKLFGAPKKEDPDRQAKKRAWAAFQTDPQAVAGAQKWADCLRKQGYHVPSARPGDIEGAIFEQAVGGELQADSGLGPDVMPTEAATAAVGGSAPLPPERAKQALQREIKAAVTDLDCRPEDYATLVRSKYAKVLHDGEGLG